MDSELFRLIVHTAEQMIRSGAEIYRAEEGVTRACMAYGVERVDIYATTSQMIVSVENSDGSALTHSARIYSTANDMDKLDKLNKLIRDITANQPDAQYIKAELEKIQKAKKYPCWFEILMYGVVSAAFCVFFGGMNIAEPVVAFFTGIVVGLILKSADFFEMNRLISRFLASVAACIIAIALKNLGLVATHDNIVIGNIMCLISGIGLTNSLRDLFKGDTITGVLRSIEAVLLALVIAMGYVTATYVFGGSV